MCARKEGRAADGSLPKKTRGRSAAAYLGPVELIRREYVAVAARRLRVIPSTNERRAQGTYVYNPSGPHPQACGRHCH
jgi:hypothetical protein